MSYCIIFPGQGTQFVGMSKGLDLGPGIGQGLLRLMEKGPLDELSRTINAQPAVFAATIALWEKSELPTPDFVMGHSLGEYTALAVAGVLSRQDALDLVNSRAEFMEGALPLGASGMAAVLGLEADAVRSAISDVEDLWIANINGGKQVVISGMISSIDKAAPLLKDAGARRVVPLKISVASHCPLMTNASKKLAQVLDAKTLEEPRIRVVFNATAREAQDPAAMKMLLARQLVDPVLWDESVKYVVSQGITRFVEIGPGSVLAPLVKRIYPEAHVEAITQG